MVVFSERSSGVSFQDLHDEVWYCPWCSFFICSVICSSYTAPQTPHLPTNDPQHPPEQSYLALWSALSCTLVAYKIRYSGNNRPKRGWLPLPSLLSFSLSSLLYSLVHMQYGTMQRRRTGWRLMTGLVTWWHTKGQVSQKTPPQWDMCHSPAMSPTFFVVSRLSSLALSPCGHNVKAPICCGDLGLWLSELIPHSSLPFVRYADHVSLLTPLCFTHATGTKVLLFSEEMYWKCDSHLFPKHCPLYPCPSGEHSSFKRAEKNCSKGFHECVDPHLELENWPHSWPIIHHRRCNTEFAKRNIFYFFNASLVHYVVESMWCLLIYM